MLGRILLPWRWRRRARAATASPASPPAKAAAAAPQVTTTEMLQEVILGLGGPVAELDPDCWLGLARRIEDHAESAPPPPSFPRIAGQVLAIANRPTLDLNELVGIVQRDGAIATTLIRIANSALFAPASSVTTLRDAIGMIGIRAVLEVVLGSAGRAYYEVASPAELRTYPNLWQSMFDDSMANGFTAGHVALDIGGARGDRALLAGLLVDVGRPFALRILTTLVRERTIARPDDAVALATLDEVGPRLGARLIRSMNLPAELRAACVAEGDVPSVDSQLGRLVGSIAAMQRRSPRIWTAAGEVREVADRIGLKALRTRSLFAQRSQYVLQARAMFATPSSR